MVFIEASKAKGLVLDWLVAKTSGVFCEVVDDKLVSPTYGRYSPSTNWSQGGPIIEREGICVGLSDTGTSSETLWIATKSNDAWPHGPTPLVAAMRCYVLSKLEGKESVEVPSTMQTKL